MSGDMVEVPLPAEFVTTRDEAAAAFNRLPVVMQVEFAREALLVAGKNALGVFGPQGFEYFRGRYEEAARQLTLLAAPPVGRA